MKSILIILVAAISSVLSLNAAAHMLWLEGGATVSKLYFGEYGENLRETSPGKLDNIVTPMVTIVDAAGAEKSVTASRSTNYYAISGGATVLVQALKQPIRTSQDKLAPAQRGFLYARQGKGGNLPLDIQQNANKLRLTFMGKPLAKAEITLIAPNGWEKPLRTDENGETNFSLLEPGLYVAEAKYKESHPGEFEGKAYFSENHTVTFSFSK
ncbi:DUF4198 domain-containing protein [Candidatus Nitrotoga sp. AM1P]|uniref:DUF4198 domain-containing protein n=1 Tax=Candidatus Nitrotoga sp. AM1P TaxID=2559597 RepID=UPI0010B97E7F|nr:DUF4198 domain-containing protein [Candidatus Nitrotoga sp. AM1P]BBJ22449.1 hypothetical protein W01_03760 [Candidatus Nitrotoga sp. AM1P]